MTLCKAIELLKLCHSPEISSPILAKSYQFCKTFKFDAL